MKFVATSVLFALIIAGGTCVWAQAKPGQNTTPPPDLSMIKYRISRAVANIQGLGSDPAGHRVKAINYLNKALAELQAAQ